MTGWIGVDLDGTLAEYTSWIDEYTIGQPIPLMISRVKDWLDKGIEVRIFTARAHNMTNKVERAIQEWCKKNIGVVLEITNKKDYAMIELWDDRCVQVVTNTGLTIEEKINRDV